MPNSKKDESPLASQELVELFEKFLEDAKKISNLDLSAVVTLVEIDKAAPEVGYITNMTTKDISRIWQSYISVWRFNSRVKLKPKERLH